MKSIFIILSLIMSSLFSTICGQGLTKTLINDKLDELFINKDNPFGDIPAQTVEKYFSENSKLYYFEIVYNNQVIYREGIAKSIPHSRDSEIVANRFRFKYDTVYLDASLISDSDKSKLLESYKNKLIEIGQKKLISLKDFEIIKKDRQTSKYVILSPLESMKINIYRVDFQ
ncbi:hypothetical protein [Chryseobacterium wangxinyae]|uniref:hypothetical protein n=1 Tax=Chryseobacterium sp. CY353 TaxID=2997334 RepID=UPI00226F53D5|nr:hypothetical protein [Chryseobacterium sp. CY353]MCY0970859.1 hypothetical protein [Chryseobacterium sp. CY353]